MSLQRLGHRGHAEPSENGGLALHQGPVERNFSKAAKFLRWAARGWQKGLRIVLSGG